MAHGTWNISSRVGGPFLFYTLSYFRGTLSAFGSSFSRLNFILRLVASEPRSAQGSFEAFARFMRAEIIGVHWGALMVWWIGGSETVAEAIRQLERNSDRAVGIIAAAMLEEHITNAIKRWWHDSPATVRRMLQVEGPLGNFGPKIDLVFLMGLISEQGHHDLTLIKKVRNKFAHYLDVDTFETPIIRNWCFDLRHFENFVLTDEELRGPAPPRKILGRSGMDKQLRTAKGRYIVAVQLYSMVFGPDWRDINTPAATRPTPKF
jgi:hypothetical protein